MMNEWHMTQLCLQVFGVPCRIIACMGMELLTNTSLDLRGDPQAIENKKWENWEDEWSNIIYTLW